MDCRTTAIPFKCGFIWALLSLTVTKASDNTTIANKLSVIDDQLQQMPACVLDWLRTIVAHFSNNPPVISDNATAYNTTIGTRLRPSTTVVADTQCLPGLQLAPDLKSCIDIDECQMDEYKCEQLCVNRYGGYECRCVDGYLRNPNDDNGCIRDKDAIGAKIIFIGDDKVRYRVEHVLNSTKHLLNVSITHSCTCRCWPWQ